MPGRRISRSGFHRGVAGQRRQSLWFLFQLTATTVASGGKTLLVSLSASALALRPFTIVRTRARVMYQSDQLAATENPQASMGVVVVSDQAVAAGGASIPGPITNPDAPWLVYEGLHSPTIFLSAIGLVEPAGLVFELDSKAMRKVGNNEDIAVMIEQGATFGGIIAIQGRMLVKLH